MDFFRDEKPAIMTKQNVKTRQSSKSQTKTPSLDDSDDEMDEGTPIKNRPATRGTPKTTAKKRVIDDICDPIPPKIKKKKQK